MGQDIRVYFPEGTERDAVLESLSVLLTGLPGGVSAESSGVAGMDYVTLPEEIYPVTLNWHAEDDEGGPSLAVIDAGGTVSPALEALARGFGAEYWASDWDNFPDVDFGKPQPEALLAGPLEFLAGPR